MRKNCAGGQHIEGALWTIKRDGNDKTLSAGNEHKNRRKEILESPSRFLLGEVCKKVKNQNGKRTKQS